MAAYYNNLAQAYSKSGKIDDAVTNYTKAANWIPGRSWILFQRGRGLHQYWQGG